MCCLFFLSLSQLIKARAIKFNKTLILLTTERHLYRNERSDKVLLPYKILHICLG